jgi:hypothetical protein
VIAPLGGSAVAASSPSGPAYGDGPSRSPTTVSAGPCRTANWPAKPVIRIVPNDDEYCTRGIINSVSHIPRY